MSVEEAGHRERVVRVDEDATNEFGGSAVEGDVLTVEGPDHDGPSVGVAAVGPPAIQVLVLRACPDQQAVLPETRPGLLVEVQKTVEGALAERLDHALVVARQRGAETGLHLRPVHVRPLVGQCPAGDQSEPLRPVDVLALALALSDTPRFGHLSASDDQHRPLGPLGIPHDPRADPLIPVRPRPYRHGAALEGNEESRAPGIVDRRIGVTVESEGARGPVPTCQQVGQVLRIQIVRQVHGAVPRAESGQQVIDGRLRELHGGQ
ncbi:hypothetical protein [Streptomyces lavendulocolor]|uniref:hypothetical protein n=1 Tax=Streptomyces lavendulocolor TaxID=67316 RepID=UPI003C2AF5D7